ncbi:MAG: DNA replication and repair protein RecF [Alphaproteobacteria bacterium]|nr:DNA replication and repair protein RecF [Alphaproteobacteria bacterium]
MIERLTLTDFRNHAGARINTRGRRNIIITGPNGAGKTAVLEAVSMLAGDRGMRGAAMSDIARFGSAGFSTHAVLRDDTEIAITYSMGDANRRARIDGDVARLPDLATRLRVVWITPREDRLFVDAAAERRAFFDRLAGAFDGHHSGRVARFSKLMSERAAALKSGGNPHWMDALDTQIAAAAVAIAAARIQYAGEVNYFLETAAVSVSGMVEGMVLDNAPGAENKYLAYLRENRSLQGDKMILDGPHKSDFGVFNNALGLPAHLTSTGQQKSVLLDLILAHARLMHAKTSMQPIILLDEAAAHLDAAARAKLFAALTAADAQVWATGLDAAVFSDIGDAAFVACANGEINNILVQ